MGKSIRNKGGGPITLDDIFGDVNTVSDTFGQSTIKETAGHQSSLPSYENIRPYSHFEDEKTLEKVNANKQAPSDLAIRATKQFVANLASGLGQGLANTFDMVSLGKSAKAMVTGGNDDFESSLFGLTTKEMQDWANGVAQRNKIYENEEGGLDLTDPGWWAKQVASSGTGLGMGIEALLSTAAIEVSTGGMGTAAALAKLGNLGKKLLKGAQGAEVLNQALSTAKGLKSAATIYGIINRSSESRMEAMSSHDEIYQELSQKKNPDGTDKYTEEEKQELASEGAKRTFAGNMALLPLDIIGFRTMVYNPISGSGTGMIERVLGKIGNKYVRKAVSGTIFGGLEGTEEGFQFLAGQEGKHYARVLGGMDDGSNFGERLGKNTNDNEFWNNFAGGVIGSPVIGAGMKLIGKITQGNKAERLNQVHSEFIKNVGKMDETFSSAIKVLQTAGKEREAGILRRQFSANKALSALHLDAMTDKDSAFDAHKTFIAGVLGEINEGKTDALGDLGFVDPTPEQIAIAKEEFTNYLKDATELESIYNEVKDKYNKNFVPEIANDHFQLNKLLKEKTAIQTEIVTKQAGLSQFDQLSPRGQEIYNIEYKLQSYAKEHKRLNDLLKGASEEEKEDIQALIKETEDNIKDVDTRLNTIQNEEEYTPKQKTLDNKIISSSLRSEDYSQATSENDRLDNEIALKRSEIARWNDPAFIAKKNRESIKKATSVAHVNATRENLDKNGQNNKDTEEALQDKEAQLAANRAAQDIKEKGQDAQNLKTVPGNSSLFDDDEGHDIINGLSETILPTDPQEEEYEEAPQEAEKYLFSPAEYDFEKSSDESKQKVIRGVKGLLAKLPASASFEDLVRNVAKVQGDATADKIFNALRYGWEHNGQQPVDYDAVYDKVFNNPYGELVEGASSLIETEEQLKKENEKVEEDLAQQGKPEGFDNNNQPIYKYETAEGKQQYVTNESSPKFAFVSRLNETKIVTEGEEEVVVEHGYTEEELNTGSYVDSLQLLDPDKWNEGTEAEAKVPPNFMNILIPVFNGDGTKGKAVTFGQYIAQKSLTKDSQEYKDKLPMVIYRKGAPSTEKGVAFVHDIGWYYSLSFNQNIQHKDDRQKAIDHTRKIREAVIKGGNKAPIVVTGKRQTTFAGLKSKPVTLREANPETMITVALTTSSLSRSKGEKVFPNNETELTNVKPFTEGEVLDVRRFGNKNGKKTYVANKVWKHKLDEASKESVLTAITIYANRSNKTPAVREQHDKVVEHIKATMGLDITSSDEATGLQRYLSHFIVVYGERSKKKNEEVEARMRATKTTGTPFISFINGGNIVFGRTGESMGWNSKENRAVNSFFINPNSTTVSQQALNSIAAPNIIGWYEQNVDIDSLIPNKPVVMIKKDFTTSTTPSYNDHLLDRLTSDIKSYNIGTKENPNYVTNVQPVITYELKDDPITKVPTSEEVKADIQEPFREQIEQKETSTEETDTAAQAKKDALNRARGILGRNRGIGNDTILNPAELDANARNNVSKDILRIAGLTPDQQFQLVDFMYNQIVPMIKPGTSVPKPQVYKAVDDALDAIFKPLKASYTSEIEEITKLINYDNPTQDDKDLILVVADYKALVDKINNIYNNLDTFKELTKVKVDKYTGIQEGKEDIDYNEENEDITVEDEANDAERDFTTDILTESPEDKLTYVMRRFFGQIRQYDKEGQPAHGFLGLPLYQGADSVIRTLMVTLADVPSDFDTMIAKLETRKAAVPWMAEAIERLQKSDSQRKAQFVTAMSNHSLHMKFTMISYNRKTETWTTKIYDTNRSGVNDAIVKIWKNNFVNSDLVEGNNDGTYSLSIDRAKELISIFDSWKGDKTQIKEIENPQNLLKIRDRIKIDNPVVFSENDVPTDIRSQLGKNRVRFSLKGYEYQITKRDDGKYVAEFLKETTASPQEVDRWLKAFGIILSEGALNDLTTKGLLHNKETRGFNELFKAGTNTNGLFAILYNSIKTIVEKGGAIFEEEGNNPLDNSVVKSLANLEASYNEEVTPFGFRDGGKSIFALTAPKFITDRVRDLKSSDDKTRKELGSTSFTKHSLWLRLLDDPKFRERFSISHMGLTAFKELGKKNYKDNALSKLSDLDHELAKLGMFWDSSQGAIRYGKDGLSVYPDTNIGLRMSTMFSPTMSDKHMMTMLTTAVLSLQNKDLLNGEGISDEVVSILYDQVVKPELSRMIKHAQNGGKTDISSYDKGAAMFLLMPSLNSIEYTTGLKLVDAIKHEPNVFTLSEIENNVELKTQINAKIRGYVKALTEEKIQVWKNNGLITNTGLKYFDNAYMNKFNGTDTAKANMAAMDFVVNNLMANANSFMTMIGDPALFTKSKATNPIEIAKDTFVNVGKRLAAQIAPGTPLANSAKEKYMQVFIQDRVSAAGNIEYLESILGKEGAAPYRKLEGSDAQEYTTWKEHLDVLANLGKTPENLLEITPQEIQEARDLFASDVTKANLTDKQKDLIGKVLQPMKPVYTGQMFDGKQDVMRTMYIKSSSFPLIPQLTAGMEIDKLRVAAEKLEKTQKMNVRISYQTANKVGSLNNPIPLWKADGTIDDEALAKITDSSLVLDRKNFRIQQQVPFKSGKQGEDKISIGTQIMKLLFGDNMLNENGFMYNGKEYSGKDLHKIYNETFVKLIKEKRKQLFDELGLDANGKPIDVKKSMTELQSILKKEAIKRGYPLQDIQGLTLNSDNQFELPLWSSANSNRYESMLNAIVGNRLVKMKFPGNSYVVGSEEGFRTQDSLEGVDQSKIIFTSAWNNKSLQGSLTKDGKLEKAQVLIASKFRDNENNLVDLFTKENGEYKYITKTDAGFRLKEDMFDKELLNMSSFRIPTSGHNSASQVEIVGFLPHTSADLMIVPSGFTKQKGLDFDVDKENTYQLWHHMNKDGKFEVFNESHRDELLLAADKEVRKILAGDSADDKLLRAIFGEDVSYTKEEIADSKFLSKKSSLIDEKLMQNEIVKIHSSVLSNPAKSVQSKITRVLSTDFAESQADFIEGLSANVDDEYWTPLSDEYQKRKMFLGASGKVGVGAYALDLTFHSLAQQAALNGRPIELVEVIKDGDKSKKISKIWRFGKYKSNSQLGAVKSVDESRSVSEVLNERANIAVDNEKLQVMGRVGLDEVTLDVDKVFNLIGLDKGEDGNSIAMLFLSQPIIRDYVTKMKNASSNVSEFDNEKEAKVLKELAAKYDPQKTYANFILANENNYEDKVSDLMTNQAMVDGIKSKVPDPLLQSAILSRFLEMKDYGKAIRGVQTTINTDSKGLGKSFFDVIEKKNALNRIGMDSNMITGAKGLIGDYIDKEDLTDDEDTTDYVDVGDYLVKPDTLSGAFGVYGVTTAHNLWSDHFPYDATVTNIAFKEILGIIGKDDMTDTKTIDLKQNIFQGMKKYFAASKDNGIIQGHDDINAERKRLFIDSDENTSLAKYIKHLLNVEGNAVVNAYIKTNKLLNRFEFEIKKNGQPSLIKFNNAAGEEFDEQYLYESLATLMEVRGKDGRIELPPLGNKKYTLDTLAQDLIAYSYLGNAIQEAVQFTKYVPISYLNTVGFSQRMRMGGLWLRDNVNVLGAKIKAQGKDKEEGHFVSEFTMQYIQHNPERVNKKIDIKNFSSETIKIDDNSFQLKGPEKPTFISVYDASIQKGEKKFKLYWFDGTKYISIPVLGIFGMDEYQPRNSIGTSIVNARIKIQPNTQAQPSANTELDPTDYFNLKAGTPQQVYQAIADGSEVYGTLARRLLPLVDNTLKIEVSPELKAYGRYLPETKTILVKQSITSKPGLLANTLIHELVHDLTYDQVNRYIIVDANGEISATSDAPPHISNLIRLYNGVRGTIDQTEIQRVIKEARDTGALNDTDKNQIYGLTSIHEFITMALTNKDFQAYLNTIEYKGSGQTFLDKFKEFVADVLKSIGVEFDPNFSAAHAISLIFEVIEEENKNTVNPYQAFYDESLNNDNFDDFIDSEDDAGTVLSPSEFPNKQLTITDENCL